jgi:uroporphyrinogen-III synthase
LSVSHVVITRPQPQAGQLAKLCLQAGLIPVVVPAFAFEPLTPDTDHADLWPDDRLSRLAVFTSPRSVRYALDWLQGGVQAGSQHDRQPFNGVTLAAIGPATARALTTAGLATDIVPDAGFSSEALLEHPSLNTMAGDAVIFAAPGGRQALQTGLAERGWSVRMLEVYRRVMLHPAPQAVADIEAAPEPVSIWTSATALESLSALFSEPVWDSLRHQPMLLISERLAGIARSMGAEQPIVLPGPSNEAILEGILSVRDN